MTHHETHSLITRNNVGLFYAGHRGGWVVEWTACDGRVARVSVDGSNGISYATIQLDGTFVADSRTTTDSWLSLMQRAITYLNDKQGFMIPMFPEYPRSGRKDLIA